MAGRSLNTVEKAFRFRKSIVVVRNEYGRKT
jgi:hypothetical protein